MTDPADVRAVAAKVVGFLEESPGVKSSTRLLATWLVGIAASVVAVVDWYVVYQTVHKLPIDSLTITAAFAVICPLIGGGAVALSKRTATPDGDHP